MACPPKNAIFRGFFFIFALLIYLMCERWMAEIKVTGSSHYDSHVFNHVFFLWTWKQALLAGLYFVWRAIDKNWMGMKRFQHAEIDEPEPHRRRFIARNAPINDGESGPLLQQDGVPPRTHCFRRRKKTYPKLLFLLPSMFNQASVLLIYFGLKLTYNSSVIMLTGTAAVFVTLLSLAFLVKPISCSMWFGVVVSTVGFAISGLSDYIHGHKGYEIYGIAAGDLLFAMGQITMTTQMVYEEKFMRKLSIHPMKFLGCEGIFNIFFALVMLLVVCVVDTQYSDLPNNRIEDIADATLQFFNCWRVRLAVFGSLISYVVYTYLGMILIKDHGAMSRIMIEALAWYLYWIILVAMRWETYFISQIPGLVLVPCGVLIFSHIVTCPCGNGSSTLDPNDQGPILAQAAANRLDDDPMLQAGNSNSHVPAPGNDDQITPG